MLDRLRITKMESQVFMHPEDIKKQNQVNITYEYSIEEPIAVKLKPSGKEALRIMYTLSIVYANPSMGYIRYEGEIDCPKTGDETDITDEIRSEMAHTVMLNIMPLALITSRAMGLPPAVPLPLPPLAETQKQDTEIRGYG